MPLYEYRCKCGFRFDEFKPIEERATHPCPACGKVAQKILSVFSDTFGWRLTEKSHERGAVDNYERAV